MLSQTEITRKAAVPKLGRALVNVDVFKEVTMVPLPALEYFDGLRKKNPLSWPMVPAGSQLPGDYWWMVRLACGSPSWHCLSRWATVFAQ